MYVHCPYAPPSTADNGNFATSGAGSRGSGCPNRAVRRQSRRTTSRCRRPWHRRGSCRECQAAAGPSKSGMPASSTKAAPACCKCSRTAAIQRWTLPPLQAWQPSLKWTSMMVLGSGRTQSRVRTAAARTWSLLNSARRPWEAWASLPSTSGTGTCGYSPCLRAASLATPSSINHVPSVLLAAQHLACLATAPAVAPTPSAACLHQKRAPHACQAQALPAPATPSARVSALNL
jgi:hypothetical protein